jgi:dolichyl-phosphate-mannose-protein mannosyltransferase
VKGKLAIPIGYWALGLGAIALTLRFWRLGQPNALVFDEVYYVPFALDYWHGTPSFDAHPPLGKYFIALGIWLGHWPATWLHWPTVDADGVALSPLAFRWLNALVGATIPLLLAVLAFALGANYSPQRRRTFALLAGVMMTLEGLTLVESRLALINIYGLALGLLGQVCWLQARQSQHPARWRWGAGIALGAAINVKWSWAGLWLGLLLWEVMSGLLQPQTDPPGQNPKSKIQNLRRLVYLGLIPLVTYILLWLPHQWLTGESLLGIHRQIWAVHQSIGAGDSHPYCSPWHSWPLMLRPVAYFFERAEGTAIAIRAMGNPVLWWLSTAAIIALGLGWLARWLGPRAKSGRDARLTGQTQFALPTRGQDAVVPFILLNYLANWLPWALVSRCTFFYHAMGIATVSTLGLAWLMAQWIENSRHRWLALGLLGAIALSFWFWLPLYLGLPLSPASLQRRWLLPGWI